VSGDIGHDHWRLIEIIDVRVPSEAVLRVTSFVRLGLKLAVVS
jgi:hypothetical protein